MADFTKNVEKAITEMLIGNIGNLNSSGAVTCP